MNHNEEDLDFLGGRGDMLPADVLKLLNELLEQLHRKDKKHQGSPVFIYAPGSQYVDKQFNIGAYPRPLPKGKGVDGAEASKSLPDVLATDKAMVLWRKAQRAGYVDEHYHCSRGRRRHCWLTIWQRSWKSKINGRPSRCYGIEGICIAIITMP